MKQTTAPPFTLGASAWAIHPEALRSVTDAHRAHDIVGWAELAQRTMEAPKPVMARPRGSRASGGMVAVIPLSGLITPRGSLYSYIFGGASGGLTGFREQFREALDSSDVSAIVIDVDSPGGRVDLVPETAAEIRAARGEKPIIAIANTYAASAAYYIASQADQLLVTPSGAVGSVGVYMLHNDYSGWNERMGVKPTFVFAAPYKVEGNAEEPLSDEARADWQQQVDDIYDQFVEDVAAGRGVSTETVLSDYGEGRTLNAARALNAGMVDGVKTLEEVVGELLSGESTGRVAALGRAALLNREPRADDPPPADDDPVVPPVDGEQDDDEPEPETDADDVEATDAAAARAAAVDLFA